MALGNVAHYHFVFGMRGRPWWDGWRRCRESRCGEPEIHDRWLCTHRTKIRNEPRYEMCGTAYYFKRPAPGMAGGPSDRKLDRRYGRYPTYNCKGHHVALLRHEAAPDPEQPAQDLLLYEQIERLQVVAKEARRKRGRKKDPAAPSKGVRAPRGG